MIVYLYEKLSQNVHHFVDPRPMDSASTSAYYVSNGYLVLTPDIVYTIGYPGQSALKCVLAGVNAVARAGVSWTRRTSASRATAGADTRSRTW